MAQHGCYLYEQMARGSNAGMKTALEGAVARLLTSCECEDISTRCKCYREGGPVTPATSIKSQSKTSVALMARVAAIQATSKLDRGATEGPRLDAPLETHTLR